MRFVSVCGVGLMGLLLLVTTGCTSRGMTVTSEPPGAELSINRRVVGDTPMRVGFTHYGTYRIELRKYGYKVLVREEKVNPPVYGYDPVAAVADNLIPTRLNDEIYLHYVLKPLDAADGKEVKDGEKKTDADDKGEKGQDVSVKSPKTDADLLAERSAREQAQKSSLLERAVLARKGEITHPKTHEQIQVAIGGEAPTKAKKPIDSDQPVTIADTYTVIGPSLTPVLDLPPELGSVAPINATAPAGAELAKTYGFEPTNPTPAPGDKTGKPGEFSKPTDDKKPVAPPPVVRTPKDEELIYDKTTPKDPEEKKK